MVYDSVVVTCPYRTDNGDCVHKGCDKRCRYKNKEEMCQAYNEWLKERIVDSSLVETAKKAI